MEKHLLRKELLKKRNAMSANQKKLWDISIANCLEKSEEYVCAEHIFIFVSFGSEFYTHGLIKSALEKGKKISIPFTQNGVPEMRATRILNFDTDLELGHYGILCSKNPMLYESFATEFDLIVVPGLSFDKNGYRIGYGAGYYDRFLGKKELRAMKLGVCYSFQYMDEIPRDRYDIPIDRLITEDGFMY